MSKEVSIELSGEFLDKLENLAKDLNYSKEDVIKAALNLLEDSAKAQKEGKILAFVMPEDKMDLYINNMKVYGEIKL